MVVKVCKKCLYPSNHPLGIIFDEDGICSGCLQHKEKKIINWQDRKKDLENLLDRTKLGNNNHYDCVVPVTGGKDSLFTAHYVKNELGLKPLFVTYNSHYNSLTGLHNLQKLQTDLGCDLISFNLNQSKAKEIARYTLKNFGNFHWLTLAGQSVFPVQIAVKFKIPLIIWGMHQGIEQVGMFSYMDRIQMNRHYRRDHDLFGLEPEDLLSKKMLSNKLKNELIKLYYPNRISLEKIGLKGIYLNNYLKWDNRKMQEKIIKTNEYGTANFNRALFPFEDSNNLFYSEIHDLFKFIKYGYGKVTDHLCQEIRFNRISRKEASELNDFYLRISPKKIETFCSWIEITKADFYRILEKFKNTNLFNNTTDKNFNLIFSNSKQDMPSKLKKIISKLNIVSNIIYKEDESPISFKKTINIA